MPPSPVGPSIGLGVGVGRDTIRSADRCDLPPSPVGLSLGNGLGLGLGLVGVGLDTIRSADRCALPPPPLVGTKQPVAGRKAGRLHTPSSEPPKEPKNPQEGGFLVTARSCRDARVSLLGKIRASVV